MNNNIFVYLSSPYSKGDQVLNVKAHIMQKAILEQYTNVIVHAPLLSHFEHMIYSRPYEEWLRLDLLWISKCDCLLRLPGESYGCDQEVAEAQKLGIPVFYTVIDLIKYYKLGGN